MSKLQTNSGELFDLSNPCPTQVSIFDIAHHLSRICRYTGATDMHYSVAQHSVLMSQIVPYFYQHASPERLKQLCFAALMHDAQEAYVGDVSTPVKIMIPEFYDRVERPVQVAIQERFSIADGDLHEISWLDKRIVVNEMDRLFPTGSPAHIRAQLQPIDGLIIAPWDIKTAETEFLMQFRALKADEQREVSHA